MLDDTRITLFRGAGFSLTNSAYDTSDIVLSDGVCGCCGRGTYFNGLPAAIADEHPLHRTTIALRCSRMVCARALLRKDGRNRLQRDRDSDVHICFQQTPAKDDSPRLTKPIGACGIQSAMQEMIAVDGSPLAPESIRMMEYLKQRAGELTPADICTKIRAAADELEDLVAAVSDEQARLRPIPGKWTIAEVVDHIAQTQVRAAEELRHLLAGRRPPLPPVYEALRSGAAQWAPWNLMQEDLRDANRALLDVLADAPGKATPHAPTVKTLVVALRKLENGSTLPQSFFAEIAWKEYALLQRLHLLDHRTQVKKLMAAI